MTRAHRAGAQTCRAAHDGAVADGLAVALAKPDVPVPAPVAVLFVARRVTENTLVRLDAVVRAAGAKHTPGCNPLFRHGVPVPTEACLRVAPDRPVALLRERINNTVASMSVVVELLTRNLHDPVKGKTEDPQHEQQRHVFVRSSWSACFGAVNWGGLLLLPRHSVADIELLSKRVCRS